MESLGPLFDETRSSDREEGRGAYEQRLFACLPLYSTRLVREADIPLSRRIQLRSPGDVASLLTKYFEDKANEEFLVVMLDAAHSAIGILRASVGGLAASIVEPREVFRAAILGNAAAVVLAHNHPSGNTEPSREDIRITRQLVEAGKIMGIPVLDHLIVGGRTFTSLAERGLFE